ncbi:MAG: DUF2723 domain-containing protein [Anaerolineae bacterium]|nr:DUF2723 domain-containing protein [Anaerolineae bacterium]
MMSKNHSHPYWIDLGITAALFSLALLVYNATLTPSLSYKSPDGNELATVPYLLGLVHSTGYPLYTWLGKLFTFIPIGDVAHRMNLMSAILGAMGVGLLYLIIMLNSGQSGAGLSPPAANRPMRRITAMFTALLFAFSLTFWSQTGIAEVYAPNVFMIILTLLTLLIWARLEERARARSTAGVWRRFLPSGRSLALLFIFGLLFGLSLGTHMSNLGFAPAFALFIILVSWRTALSPLAIMGGGLGFCLGVLQFLWLPYKAATLNDPFMLQRAPATLAGIYNYTLGAFPQFKFAFAWWQLPERIVLYQDILRQQYGLGRILLGLYGMAELLWRRPKRFFLLIGMYLFHVWFFIQYRVFDLDVFFIPAHLLYVIFIGFGVTCLGGYVVSGWRHSTRRKWLWLGATGLLAALLGLAVAGQVKANWASNDYSKDTAINDFYHNVWTMLPANSVLLGQGGVFGYDMFYWRLVYNVRPDVTLPMIEGPRPDPNILAGRTLYTTTPTNSGGPRNLGGPAQQGRTPWSPPANMSPAEAWYVPVLIGGGDDVGAAPRPRPGLTLYRVQNEPPQLSTAQPTPQFRVNQSFGSLTLLGYDLASATAQPGGRLELTLYWQAQNPPPELIATSLGELRLEQHEFGLGNLSRYLAEVQPPPSDAIVESYTVVVPSTITPGEYPLTVSLQSRWPVGRPGLAEPDGKVNQPAETITLANIVILTTNDHRPTTNNDQ